MMHGSFLGVAVAALLLGNPAADKPEAWRGCKIYRDVRYGPRPDEKGKRSGQFLDLIMPEAGVKAETPVYVHIHGGSWCQSYNKDDENLYLLTSIARSGWLVVNANYCLADEREAAAGKLSVTFDDMLADIDAVLAFLRDRALPELGIDARGVALGGCSAGAQLALVAAARGGHPLPVAMVYAQVPPADLLHPRFKEGEPYFRLLAKGDIKRYSPVELVRRGSPPAVVASMGGDELVPPDIFHKLTNAYHRAGVEVSASLTPGCGHGDLPRELEADVVRRINRMAVRTGLARNAVGEGTVLWPNGDCQILPLTDRRWPGWNLDFKGKARDLSDASCLVFSVSNRTASALNVTASVKGVVRQGQVRRAKLG